MRYYSNSNCHLHQQRNLILQQLINVIPQIGFNQQALILASQNASLDANYWKIVFPRGLTEVASSIEAYFDQLMIDQLDNMTTPISVNRKIITALQIRIKLVPQITTSNLLSFYVRPGNYYSIVNSAWRSCDRIWIYACDKSLDFNYYSKRSLLMLCYIASTVYYSNDKSDNFCKTDLFISDVIAKISNIGKLKQKIKYLRLDDIPILRFFL